MGDGGCPGRGLGPGCGGERENGERERGANDQVRSGKEPQVRGSTSWVRRTFLS